MTALAGTACASPPSAALTDRDCPEGATVVGAAPPKGFLQRCELPGGVRHGKSRAWYETGKLRYETEWWQGVKHGKFTMWYPSGAKRAEGEDRHGVPDGMWRQWTERGALAEERSLQGVATAEERSLQGVATAEERSLRGAATDVASGRPAPAASTSD